MKKTFAWILATIIVLTGCGNSVPVESPAETQTETPDGKEAEPKVGDPRLPYMASMV